MTFNVPPKYLTFYTFIGVQKNTHITAKRSLLKDLFDIGRNINFSYLLFDKMYDMCVLIVVRNFNRLFFICNKYFILEYVSIKSGPQGSQGHRVHCVPCGSQ